MFPSRYFADRFFPIRYFPPVGAEILLPGPALLQPLTITWDMPVRDVLSATPDRTVTWDMPIRNVESN